MDWVLSTGSALLLAAAHPPWSADLLAWVALVPLLLALEGKSAGRRLAVGLWCGTLWSGALVGPWLWPALAAALPVGAVGGLLLTFLAAQLFGGVHVGLFAWLCRPSVARLPWAGPLATAALWVAVELVRTHAVGAIPWALLGHSQWRRALIIQGAELGGVAVVSFLLTAVNAGVFATLAALRDRERPWRVVRSSLVPLSLLALSLLHAAWRLGAAPAGEHEIAVQIVHSAWESRGDDESSELLRHMVDLTSRADPGDASLVVWPENSLRFYVQQGGERAAAIRELVRSRNQSLLAGGPRFELTSAGTAYFNSAHLFAADGDRVGVSDKRFLVPLAESRLAGLPAVERPFEPGVAWEPMLAGDTRLGVLICFEAIFPAPARQLVGGGATALVNITNDQLVGAGAAQQAAMAVFRAVENRVPLVRVSNLGPTLVVDRFGRIVTERVGEGTIIARLRSAPERAPTFYGRHGDLFALLCLAPAVWMVSTRSRRAN